MSFAPAYTCYLSYADQSTGLGPDEMTMSHGQSTTTVNPKQGLWITELATWEKNGRPGGVPPGLNKSPPVQGTDERDYFIRRDGWFLRPEVRLHLPL